MLVWRVLCAGVGVLSAGVEGPVCWCGSAECWYGGSCVLVWEC